MKAMGVCVDGGDRGSELNLTRPSTIHCWTTIDTEHICVKIGQIEALKSEYVQSESEKDPEIYCHPKGLKQNVSSEF